MDYFHYKDGAAWCEDVPLERIANEVGTPAYVYSKATLVRHLERLKAAFKGYPTLPCFAVKANGNISLLREIFRHGYGADLVSLGELKRSLAAGVAPERVVYSGVGKKGDEIAEALDVGILSFNVESAFELAMIAKVAEAKGKVAPVSLRINPNIDAQTNPKIATGLYSTKFGMSEDEARALVAEVVTRSPALELVGIACHIGSQITDLKPMREAAARMAALASELKQKGHPLRFIDMGGGLGIRYRDEVPPELEDYAATLFKAVEPTGLELVVEPGRVLVGNIGVLLNRVIGIKRTPQKNFAIVDGAMNDLIRPSMYDSFHEILPATLRQEAPELYDIVGPICESGDFFGKDRSMAPPKAGDLVYVRAAGAYAASMASNYNSRPRAPEVLVDGQDFKVIRKRETYEQIFASEL